MMMMMMMMMMMIHHFMVIIIIIIFTISIIVVIVLSRIVSLREWPQSGIAWRLYEHVISYHIPFKDSTKEVFLFYTENKHDNWHVDFPESQRSAKASSTVMVSDEFRMKHFSLRHSARREFTSSKVSVNYCREQSNILTRGGD